VLAMASSPARTFLGHPPGAAIILTEDRFGVTPKPARETRALPMRLFDARF